MKAFKDFDFTIFLTKAGRVSPTLREIEKGLESMRSTFDLFDGDKDGTIVLEEFYKVMHAMGP